MGRSADQTEKRLPAGQGKPLTANLSSLTIGSLTLDPAFDSGTTVYAASTTNATNKVTAVAEAGSVKIKVGDTEIQNDTAATWADGENTLTVTVTNGAATKTYTVTVTKT